MKRKQGKNETKTKRHKMIKKKKRKQNGIKMIQTKRNKIKRDQTFLK